MVVPVGVESLIRRTFSGEARAVSYQHPGDWAVARVQLVGAELESAVLKWVRSDRNGWRTEPQRLITEVIGLQFVHELAPGLVPQVLGFELNDQDGGIVLLEDLTPRIPLYAAIRDRGAAATTAVRGAFARAMGRLAACTAGHDHEFGRRLGSDVAGSPDASRVGVLGQPWARMRPLIESFGVSVSAEAEHERSRLHALLAEPGPFLTLSNGDMATNNFMITPGESDDGRLIDFESAHFDHALAHVANFFVPGPPWMVINDPIAADLDHQFRTALAAGVPEAADDELYDEGVAAGCVAMGFERCGNLPTMDRRPPGDQSRAQRVLTLESAAREADRRGHWPALAGLHRDLAAALRRRWPDVTDTLATLPPYAPRG